MKPCFDGDMILYEVGFAAEARWKHICAEKGEEAVDPPPPQIFIDMLEYRIANTCAMVNATEPPVFYFTGKDNFRFQIARTSPYKQRPGNKPHDYHNIKNYLLVGYECFEHLNLEADDLLAIELTNNPDTSICCSRDKDLKQVPGWHYSWELMNQPEFGPFKVEGFGKLMLSSKGKLSGWGEKFFWSQMLTGDQVDTIPGVPGVGPAKAFKLLEGVSTTEEAIECVSGAYKRSYGLYWNEVMLEQGRLLWMVRGHEQELWSFPYA